MRCEFLRDYHGAHVQAQEALDRSTQSGIRWGIIYGTIGLGRIMVAGEAADVGIEKLAEEMPAAEAWDRHLGYWLAAGAYLKARRVAEGTEIVDQAIVRVAAGGPRLFESDLHRLKAELILTGAGPQDEAVAAFSDAIAIARRQQAKSFELRATLSLARLLAQQGRRDEARAMLAEIYNWFTEGFDTADLKDAKALLDELAAL